MKTLIIQNVMKTLIIQAALAAKSFALRATAKALYLEAEAVKADGQLYIDTRNKAVRTEEKADRISKYLSPKDWEKETADDWENEVSASEAHKNAAWNATKATEILREHAQFMADRDRNESNKRELNEWAKKCANMVDHWREAVKAWDNAKIVWDRAVQARKAAENEQTPANP